MSKQYRNGGNRQKKPRQCETYKARKARGLRPTYVHAAIARDVKLSLEKPVHLTEKELKAKKRKFQKLNPRPRIKFEDIVYCWKCRTHFPVSECVIIDNWIFCKHYPNTCFEGHIFDFKKQQLDGNCNPYEHKKFSGNSINFV